MKRILSYLLLGVISLMPLAASAQAQVRYRRPSLYSMMLKHTEQKYADIIEEQFLTIPIPDKFNDHDLSVKVLSVSKKDNYGLAVDNFIENNFLAARMLNKWFDRDQYTGECGLDLIIDRGIADASSLQRELADRSTRGRAMLADAGEELIGNSFLLVNEINYVDKSEKSKTWGAILGAVVEVGAATAGLDSSTSSLLGSSVNDLTASFKGFKVNIVTRLYQLQWDEETQGTFYKEYWASEPDEAKVKAFNRDRANFKLNYVGEITSKGGTTSFLGINEDKPEMMVRKACQRAIDQNIADLAKNYSQFRIVSPIIEVKGQNRIMVDVGLKEGVSADSEFEVIMPEEKEDGRIVYKKVADIKPINGLIWDNRFMAEEENAYGATFGATTFKKTGGGEVIPGMLVREKLK